MNLPNKLTILRMIMIPFVLLFMLPIPFMKDTFASWNTFIADWGMFVAMIIFSLASLTDMLDGRIARSRNIVTNLGKFLDPIADKMLVISVLIALVQTGRVHAIFTIIIIMREFMVTGIRLLASDHGVVIAASNIGKAKTVTQMIAIIWLMLEQVLIKLTASLEGVAAVITWIGNIALLIAVVMTLVSGWDYLKKNLSFLKS